MVSAKGFTLIELVVVMVILLLLLAAGVPLASGWSNSSSAQHAASLLKQAMGMAKAKALSNPLGVAGDNPAATLVVADGTSLCVYAGAASSMSCSSTAIWRGSVSAILTLNGSTTQCVAFSNAGTVLSSSVSSTTCGTALTYIARKGSKDVSGTLN